MEICSNSYATDINWRDGDFVLSSVNKHDLKRYGIAMSVADFKNEVCRSSKYKTIMTGGGYRYRHTRVYNYNDFVKVPLAPKCKQIKF